MPPINLPSLVVTNPATTSNIIGGSQFDFAESIAIHGDPAAMAGVTTVEVADTEPGDAVTADFRTLQSGGADVTVTQDDTTVITNIAFRSLRVSTTVTPVAAETHDVTIHERVGLSIYK